MVGLTGGLEGAPEFSFCTCSSISECFPSANGLSVVGEWTSVRGDLCGGVVPGLVEERLLEVGFIELTLTSRDQRVKQHLHYNVARFAPVYNVCGGVVT